jgi:hypothetical protein
MERSESVITPNAMLKKWKEDVVRIPETTSQGGSVPGMGGDIIKGLGQKCQVEESGSFDVDNMKSSSVVNPNVIGQGG